MSKVEQTFIEKVAQIQKTLKAPKNQKNTFGNYNYRNQEDILEAVKPLLAEAGLVLTITDDIYVAMNRIYVKSIATITDGTNTLQNSALAREPEDQKGMNAAQLTGSTSSYARKYCLNGLFLIDDTKDADTDEVTAASRGEKVPEKKSAPAKTASATAKVVESVPEKKEEPKAATPAKPGGFKGMVRKTPTTAKPAAKTSSSEELY